jgi:hypothetical protein
MAVGGNRLNRVFGERAATENTPEQLTDHSDAGQDKKGGHHTAWSA